MPWIALAGIVGGAAILRVAVSAAKRINQELEELRLRRVVQSSAHAELKTLRRDPASGAYRPS